MHQLQLPLEPTSGLNCCRDQCWVAATVQRPIYRQCLLSFHGVLLKQKEKWTTLCKPVLPIACQGCSNTMPEFPLCWVYHTAVHLIPPRSATFFPFLALWLCHIAGVCHMPKVTWDTIFPPLELSLHHTAHVCHMLYVTYGSVFSPLSRF